MPTDGTAAPVLVLLRAVNVGGRNMVPMVALAEALTGDGFADVRTYIQSGNVVLTSGLAAHDVAARVRGLLTGDLLERRLGAVATVRNWSTVTTLAAMMGVTT